jgi:hypothetical protein
MAAAIQGLADLAVRMASMKASRHRVDGDSAMNKTTKSGPMLERPIEVLPPPSRLARRAVPFERVQQRAYEIYLARNGQAGDAVSDWLLAERELAETDGLPAQEPYEIHESESTQLRRWPLRSDPED